MFRAILKLCQAYLFQSFFASPANYRSTPQTADIDRILTFWFDHPNPVMRWFRGGPELDVEVREQFGGLVDKARASELDEAWLKDPKGTLALLILLDQFPRNIFRGSPLSYSSDTKAASIATQAIGKGIDRSLPIMQQLFFYLPLVHCEDLTSQVAAVSLCESYVARCEQGSDDEKVTKLAYQAAVSHKDIIQKFGRFPSRNEVLGRVSTAEEVEFLKDFPGF